MKILNAKLAYERRLELYEHIRQAAKEFPDDLTPGLLNMNEYGIELQGEQHKPGFIKTYSKKYSQKYASTQAEHQASALNAYITQLIYANFNRQSKTNREAINARHREWYAANKEAIKARQHERYMANKEAIDTRNREWYAANKETIKNRKHERYAAKRQQAKDAHI